MEVNTIVCGDALTILKMLPDESIDMIMTSPPYYCLRDYGIDGQIGLETTPQEYLEKLWAIFDEVKRILKKTGTCFVVLGDTYAGSGCGTNDYRTQASKSLSGKSFDYNTMFQGKQNKKYQILPAKCLLLIPERFAIGMVEHGWILRNKNIWHKRNAMPCLSGMTPLFAYVNNKPIVAPLKEIIRLYPKINIELPASNGGKVKIVGYKKTFQEAYHITFRDGVEINASFHHKFILENGQLIEANNLRKGFVIKKIPHKLQTLNYSIFNYEWGWFLGLYLAEGSEEKNGIRLSLNKDELGWAEKLNKLFNILGVICTPHIYNNNLVIQIHSEVIKGIVKNFTRGQGAKKKRLTRYAFQYGKDFVKGIIDGWLDGDGHFEKYNNRYTATICRNKGLIDDLRVCALISEYMFRARSCYVEYQNGKKPAIRINVRKNISYHKYNRKSDTEIMRITKCKNKMVLYDIEVNGDNLFTLANGALSHNSSVKDRFNCTWEYVYFFSKSKRYYFDLDSVRVPIKTITLERYGRNFGSPTNKYLGQDPKIIGGPKIDLRPKEYKEEITAQIARKYGYEPEELCPVCGRKWKRHASPNAKDRQAGIKREFIPCVAKTKIPQDQAETFGSPRARNYRNKTADQSYKVGGMRPCPEPNDPEYRRKMTAIKTGRKDGFTEANGSTHPLGKNPGDHWDIATHGFMGGHFAVFPGELCIKPILAGCPKGGIVLDPFAGSGTVGVVAKKLGRNYILIDLKPEYCEMARKRIQNTQPNLL